MFPNPDFPQKEQAQATIEKAKNILNQYSFLEIQALIARERNLEKDAIRFENIAAKELLIKKIKDKMDTIAQLEKDKQAITAEIQKFKATAEKSERNKIKRQKKQEKKKLQTTQPQELPLPKLPIPPLNIKPLHIKPPKSKLKQTVAIKRTLMRANSCNTEIELKKVYFDYCERTNSRCIFKEITDKSAWHYDKKTNSLKIFFADVILHNDCDSSSSSDDS